MSDSISQDSFETHRVFNQSPLFGGHNAFLDDRVLRHVAQNLPSSVREGLVRHGAWAGDLATLDLARLANKHTPILKSFDSKGNRIDLVEFHPSWHELMRWSIRQGMHCSCWDETADEVGCRHLVRALRYYMTSGVESGHLCPITMTNACVATLRTTPALAAHWLPLIVSRDYDPSNQPAHRKRNVILGMGMTEKQGGSDVRANTTRAEPCGPGANADGWYRLRGHKWFMSAPQADAFLILAQMPEGLGCFLVPRILEDGGDNGLRFQRLKDKLGNRSNASSEVEFHGSIGQLVGYPGKGVQTIIEMVTLTRLDCAVASVGLMRAALWEAIDHCRHRSVMGYPLIDQPLMRNVLADMTLDVVAASLLAFRLASAFDRSATNASEAAYARLMTLVVKYWTCKTAPPLVYEAMECLGGNGFVEEGNLARHYREAPLNAIWEGSGNVMCLGVMRAIAKQPETLDAVLEIIRNDLVVGGIAGDNEVGDWIDSIRTAYRNASMGVGSARVLTERLALVAAAAELCHQGFGLLASAFCRSRLDGVWRSTYGMLDGHFVGSILEIYGEKPVE